MSQIGRMAGSIMAKGPPRQRGSNDTNAIVARPTATSTAMKRMVRRSSAKRYPAMLKASPPRIAGAAELTAMASQAVSIQWLGPMLITKASATLSAIESPYRASAALDLRSKTKRTTKTPPARTMNGKLSKPMASANPERAPAVHAAHDTRSAQIADANVNMVSVICTS